MARSHLPHNAKRVFKGVIFEVWQWEQEMYDGSMRVFERIKRPDTVLVVPVVGERIMIPWQEQPGNEWQYLSLAGGRREEDEEPLETAKRELLEETGLTSDDWELLIDTQPVAKMQWDIYIYVARACEKTAAPHLDGGEIIREKYFTFDEFLMLPDDKSFYDREIGYLLLRARLDPSRRDALHKTLFGS